MKGKLFDLMNSRNVSLHARHMALCPFGHQNALFIFFHNRYVVGLFVFVFVCFLTAETII